MDDRLAADRRITDLACWWTQASQEARFETLRASIKGERTAPPFADLRIALYIAEAEAGQIAEG